jgi:hypothetical protein
MGGRLQRRAVGGRLRISVGAIFWALKVSYVIVEKVIPVNLAPVPGRPRREAVQRLQVRWWSWPTTPGRTAPERSVRRMLRYADLSETTVRTCQDRQGAEGIIRPRDPQMVALLAVTTTSAAVWPGA